MQEGDEGRTRKIEILMRVVVGITGLSLVGGERRRRDGGGYRREFFFSFSL